MKRPAAIITIAARTLGIIAKIEGVKYGLLYSRVRLKGMDLREALNDIKKSA